MSRLSKVALILLRAFPPATLLALCLDYRIEADPGSGGNGRNPTGGGEPITATIPRRRSGTPLSSAVKGDLERALGRSLLPPRRPGSRPVPSVEGLGYRRRLAALRRKGDWGRGDAERTSRERVPWQR